LSKPKRIYQIAKQINISHQEIVSFLQEQGQDVTNHMSPVDEETCTLILKQFAEDLYNLEQEQKESERKALEEQRRLEEEERIRHQEEEKAKREEEERQRKESEEQRRAEIEEAKRQAVEDKVRKAEEERQAKIEAEEAAKRAKEEAEQKKLTEAERAKKKAEKPKILKPGATEAAKTDAPADKIIAKKIERKIKHVLKDTPDKARGKRGKKRRQFDAKEVDASIKKVMTSLDEGKKRKRRRRDRREEEAEKERIVRVSEYISVHDFADLMELDVADVIGKCMDMGMMVTINQRIDKDTIELLAQEFEVKVSFEDDVAEMVKEEVAQEEEDEDNLMPRPPVVTIMGHVDHGKTSLLDYIREANVIAGEAGGITQHIGAYAVELESGKKITFLDTPGHEAFTAMRARGAQVTDVVVIIVAADDAVMPQTVEAIDHAKAAGVPIIIAINKTDLPAADAERVRRELSEHDMLVESWGGKIPDVEISAKFGNNVPELMDTILLETEILDLKANPEARGRGTVVESKLDKGLGAVATVLISRGTLSVGDPFVCGDYSGRVRALMNERGVRQESAGPATPVQVLGFSDVPRAGDNLVVMASEREAREVSTERQQIRREQDFQMMRHQTLDEISRQIAEGKVKEVALVIKGDVDGSVEALADSFMKLSNNEVAVSIKHKGIGMIKESDILLASASDAVVIGFNVTSDSKARMIAKAESVEVRHYSVIYDAVEDIHQALEGMLEPDRVETEIGTAEVLDLFKIPKLGLIAGSKVTSGIVKREAFARVMREDELVFEGEVDSLKRFKDDVKEVIEGTECGIGLKDFTKFKVGDQIVFYTVEEVKRKLETTAG